MDTGQLSGLPGALADIASQARETAEGLLGVIAFSILPEAGIYRLLPESARRLHLRIGERIRARLRDEDRLYAIDDWEWLIVLPELKSASILPLAMMKLAREFASGSLVVDGLRLRTTAVCGSAIHPDDGDDPLHLVQSARIARLQAEREAQQSRVYERSLEDLDARLMELESELRRAFESAPGLQLHLQPQIDSATRHCFGAEALLRWTRRSGEPVAPMNLLAAIERFGMRTQFLRWLFQNACRTIQALGEAGISIKLSVNLGANDLLDPEVPDLLAQALDVWILPENAIQLEITETSMVEETDAVRAVLQRFRDLGVGLSIDDFGTGFSGMSYLRTLPVHEIKVDQSFIFNIASSVRDREIVASIITLARRLELRVVAEGVETEEAATIVTGLGCHGLQGFHFARAMPLDAFIVWHRNWEARV